MSVIDKVVEQIRRDVRDVPEREKKRNIPLGLGRKHRRSFTPAVPQPTTGTIRSLISGIVVRLLLLLFSEKEIFSWFEQVSEGERNNNHLLFLGTYILNRCLRVLLLFLSFSPRRERIYQGVDLSGQNTEENH